MKSMKLLLCLVFALIKESVTQVANTCAKSLNRAPNNAAECNSDKSIAGSTCCFVDATYLNNGTTVRMCSAESSPNADKIMTDVLTSYAQIIYGEAFGVKVNSYNCGSTKVNDYNTCNLNLGRPPTNSSECLSSTSGLTSSQTCCFGQMTFSNFTTNACMMDIADAKKTSGDILKGIAQSILDKAGIPIKMTSYTCSSQWISAFSALLLVFALFLF
jgi:hypothetical protein